MKDEIISRMHMAHWRMWTSAISALVSIPLAMWILARGETLRFGIVVGLCTYCIVSMIDEAVLFFYKGKRQKKQS